MNSGDATNVIPDYAILKGTVRSFDMDVRESIARDATEMVTTLPPLYGVTGEMDYHIRYPVTTNDSQASLDIKEAATNVLGADKVQVNVRPYNGIRRLSFMSQSVKGAYFWRPC